MRHYLAQLPKKGRGQIRKLAEYLNVNSTLVSQVLSGPKDFTLEQAQEVALFFGLGQLDTDYFILLVQIERAGTRKLKTYYADKLQHIRSDSLKLVSRVAHERVLSDTERAVFYSSWLYSAIRLFCSIENGKSLDEVIERFEIARDRAVEILKFLVSAGLCTEENSLYKMGPQRTHIEQGSPFLLKHHANWRIKAIQRSETLEKSELMFTAPMSVSRKDFASLRESLVEMIKAVSDKVKDSKAEDIACLNLDLFWMK